MLGGVPRVGKSVLKQRVQSAGFSGDCLDLDCVFPAVEVWRGARLLTSLPAGAGDNAAWLESFRARHEDVWPGFVELFRNHQRNHGEDLLVSGVTVPQLVAQLADVVDVRSVFVADSDVRCAARCLAMSTEQGLSNNWLSAYTPDQVQAWASRNIFRSAVFVAECKTLGLPVVDLADFYVSDDTVDYVSAHDEALRLLGLPG